MRIHYLQHVPFEGLGYVAEWAERRRDRLTASFLFSDEPLPDPADFDALVVMGGPMGVHDTSEFSWLTEEKRFIERSLAAGKKIVGICLGAQLVADVLGARVYPNPTKEIGWYPVTRTRMAGTLEMGPLFPERFDAFHWHGDTFDLPSGSVHLAESRACRHQAFYHPSGALGLQFHLESTRESIEMLLHHCGEELVPGKYIQGREQIRAQAARIRLSNDCMARVLDRFLANPAA